MADGIVVDHSELRRLSLDLGQAAAKTIPAEVRAIIKRGAQNVKTEMQEDAKASRHLSQVGRTITYSMEGNGVYSAAEVGPDRARGASAGLAGAYYGWPGGGGATLPLDAPLDHEAPRLEKALADLLGGLL